MDVPAFGFYALPSKEFFASFLNGDCHPSYVKDIGGKTGGKVGGDVVENIVGNIV